MAEHGARAIVIAGSCSRVYELYTFGMRLVPSLLRSSLALALAFAGACSSAPTPAGDPDAGSGDGGPPPDASGHVPVVPVGPPSFREPVEVGALETWVWVGVPEMTCSDGSAGGFAVNFTDASRDLVIYLQGGGICYDAITCAGGGASTSVGDDPLRTALDGSIRAGRGIFDRTDPSNPLRDSSFVVLPHCTGDHHTGHRISTYRGRTFHHLGYTNITRMLERVAPTFADAGRVVVAGFSAGGVGIAANYHQIADAFESFDQPPPFLIVDGGPFMRPPYLNERAQETLRASWALDETIGTFCPSCLEEGFHEAYRVNAELHRGVRASLVCSGEDSVVRLLYGVLNGETLSGAEMTAGLIDVADWADGFAAAVDPSRFEVFYYGGERHGALNVAALSATPGLSEFLAAQLGTGAWDSVRF